MLSFLFALQNLCPYHYLTLILMKFKEEEINMYNQY